MRKEHYKFEEKERSIKRFAKRAERWELEDYYRAVLDELGARKSGRKRSEEGKKMRKSGKIIAFLAILFCLIGIFLRLQVLYFSRRGLLVLGAKLWSWLFR